MFTYTTHRKFWNSIRGFTTLLLIVLSRRKKNSDGYFCFFCFLVRPLFFCPFFFFLTRAAFSPTNKLLECPTFFEAKSNPFLGLLAFFKLGFEFCFSFSLLTERMTLSFLPISSELFNFRARWTASVFWEKKKKSVCVCKFQPETHLRRNDYLQRITAACTCGSPPAPTSRKPSPGGCAVVSFRSRSSHIFPPRRTQAALPSYQITHSPAGFLFLTVKWTSYAIF